MAPDEVFDEVRKEFSDEEIVSLTLAIVAINTWNRFMVGFKAEAGRYEPGKISKGVKSVRKKAGVWEA